MSEHFRKKYITGYICCQTAHDIVLGFFLISIKFEIVHEKHPESIKKYKTIATPISSFHEYTE